MTYWVASHNSQKFLTAHNPVFTPSSPCLELQTIIPVCLSIWFQTMYRINIYTLFLLAHFAPFHVFTVVFGVPLPPPFPSPADDNSVPCHQRWSRSLWSGVTPPLMTAPSLSSALIWSYSPADNRSVPCHQRWSRSCWSGVTPPLITAPSPAISADSGAADLELRHPADWGAEAGTLQWPRVPRARPQQNPRHWWVKPAGAGRERAERDGDWVRERQSYGAGWCCSIADPALFHRCSIGVPSLIHRRRCCLECLDQSW